MKKPLIVPNTNSEINELSIIYITDIYCNHLGRYGSAIVSNGISVAIISPMGNTPHEVSSSFIFDEAFRLASKGVDIHVQKFIVENNSISYGMHFHGLSKKIEWKAAMFSIANLGRYPFGSFLMMPKTIYWQNLCALNVVRNIKKKNINIIHAHFGYPEGMIAYLANNRTKIPLV